MRAKALLSAAFLLAVGSVATADAHVTNSTSSVEPAYVQAKVPGSPVAAIETTVAQPDGATFQAVPWGDAALSGLATPDGYTLVQTATGEWRYADGQRADGSLRPTAARPDEDPVPPGVAPNQRPGASQVEVMDVPLGSPVPGAAEAPFRPHSGNAPSLVILAEFTDQAGTTSQADWAGKFFGGSGSVKDYFDEVSYGALDVVPAAESSGNANNGVVGWLELPYGHPDVGVTNIGETKQILAHDAIVAANGAVNYKSFDKNKNGAIEPKELHITVILAGYETSYTGSSNPLNRCGDSVWGHQWTLDGWFGTVSHPDRTPKPDGVFVGGHGGSYTMFGERHCIKPADAGTGHIATIGIMVHELGHDLGWPDLYDTWNEGPGGTSNGVGYWSVMAYDWGFTPSSPEIGSVPPHPDAWSKVAQGWVVPQQVIGPVTIQQSADAGDVYQMLPNPNGVDWNFVHPAQAGTGEYFLVENRQQAGYDAGLPDPACGIVIFHIDETRDGDNYANAYEARRLVDVEEADGFAQLDAATSLGDAGDPWPGTEGKTAFNDSSNPNSRKYGSGTSSGVAVSGISGCSPNMSATIASPGPFPPGKPTIGTATAGKNVDAKVAFTPNPNTGGATPSYVATCKSSNGGATKSKTGAASPLTVTSLTVGKTYTCRVLAKNVAGSSAQSAASNAIKAVKPPKAPTDVKAARGNESAKVSFDPPTSVPDTGGSPITGYEARCRSSNGGATKSKAGGGSPITVTGLTHGKTYRCDVRAKNVAGWSPYSSQAGPFVP